ncbi:peptidase inhibitor family I36 protein [Streptomyces radicis]|uniref:Peptidase inhibitor n=1 Tax=Streptomyces radicis TaxID=1750517 RepID=A0A3A9VTK1_9ACTN|nr:peptidase inhibitor family I36 protein [Streptomyces radicis]RKN04315.1 hypothetical protein D7319_28700 [Streptomyces radicis]RKN14822.1 hypothetical protein D7318_28455 [Streptomyces radicis]
MNALKKLTLLGAAGVLALTGMSGNARAEDARSDIGTQAACAAGNVCVWDTTNTSGRQCSWSGNDNNWRSGTTVCSWAGTSRVRYIENNGGPGLLIHVRLYSQADYQGSSICVPRGTGIGYSAGRTFLSHRWVSSC